MNKYNYWTSFIASDPAPEIWIPDTFYCSGEFGEEENTRYTLVVHVESVFPMDESGYIELIRRFYPEAEPRFFKPVGGFIFSDRWPDMKPLRVGIKPKEPK